LLSRDQEPLHRKAILIGALALLVLGTTIAPAAPAEPPVQLVPTKILTQFAPQTFLESIVTTPQAGFRVTSYLEGKIYSVDSSGEAKLFAKIDGKIAGLALECPGELLVSGWANGRDPAVFRVMSDGKSELVLKLEGAIFPNGWSHLKGSRFLLADSFKGVIWEVDAAKRTARVWLQHELLGRSDETAPVPGVNGLKIFGHNLFASNGQRQLLLRIPITAEGGAGDPEVLASGLFVDDFAFDIKGNLYGATHTRNGVVKVAPDGAATTIGGIEQGLAGSTAVAFGRGETDRDAIFVTTNGGMSMPPPGGVQPGRVVRLEVGERGAPLCF
jgi:hypothetical protein